MHAPTSLRARLSIRSHVPRHVAVTGLQGVSKQQHKLASWRVQAGRNLVLAIDTDPEGSYKALEYTLQHIYRQGDVLHLVHVVPASVCFWAQGQCLASTLPPEEGLQEQMAARARQYFEQHFMQLAQQSGATVKLDLVHGACNQTVSKAICQKVDDLAASLVILNVQRKRSFIENFFQDPVSTQVAESCPRPTLILHDMC